MIIGYSAYCEVKLLLCSKFKGKKFPAPCKAHLVYDKTVFKQLFSSIQLIIAHIF